MTDRSDRAHHRGTTDPAEALAAAMRDRGLLGVYPEDGEAVLASLREAGWTLARRPTEEECESGFLW